MKLIRILLILGLSGLLLFGCGDDSNDLKTTELQIRDETADLLVKELTEGYAENPEKSEQIDIRNVHYVIRSDGDIWLYWSTYNLHYARYDKHFQMKSKKLGYITIANNGTHGYSLTILSRLHQQAVYSGKSKNHLLPVDAITFGHYEHAQAIKLKKMIQLLRD